MGLATAYFGWKQLTPFSGQATTIGTLERPATTGTTIITTSTLGQAGVQVETFLDRLRVPWSLAFAADGRIFLTERPGSVRIVENGKLRAESFAQLDVASVGEGGLLGLALSPSFSRDRYVYLYHTYRESSALWNRIVRLTDAGSVGTDLKVIFDKIPGGNIHDGGRIRFGPDGKLYATAGETGRREIAQDLNSLGGKILRLNPDGSIPNDNPFPGSAVYSYGHRNPQGIDFQPRTGRLYETEHGPSGELGFAHDEINLIQPGKNYGWPIIVGKGNDPRFVDPLIDTGDETWAPSGASFYSGDQIPQWKDSFFVATLRGVHLHRIVFSAQGDSVVFQEKLYDSEFGRLRDVLTGPDGALYVVTNNTDGRGSPRPNDDRILRLFSKR